MKFSSLFAFIINLDSHFERYQRAQLECVKLGISPTRIIRLPAVVCSGGKSVADRVVGTIMSHVSCIQKAQKLDLSEVLICEDDLVVDLRWFSKWLRMQVEFAKYTESWDLFYLGYRRKEPDKIIKNFHHLRMPSAPYTTHCYLVHSRAYEKIQSKAIEWINNKTPIDVGYAAFVKEGLVALGVYPRLVLQRPGWSTILNKKTDYTSLLQDK